MIRMPMRGYFLYLPVRETTKPMRVEEMSIVPIMSVA